MGRGLQAGERERRLLLTLVQQRGKEDASKFVAVYGENVSSDQDLAGVESKQTGKLGKVERALEERLRALLADLELLLMPLLGSGSRVHSLLSSLCAPELGDDGEPLAAQPAPLSLLTLLDSSLQDLPWEGLGPSLPSTGAAWVGTFRYTCLAIAWTASPPRPP